MLRSKQNRKMTALWAAYGALLLVSAVLQSLPGGLLFGLRPAFILPLCIAVSLNEGEFAGALFGAVGGLLWDHLAGRPAGMLALLLLVVCFFVSALFQLYLRDTPLTTALLSVVVGAGVLSLDYLFFYAMPGYAGGTQRYLTAYLPSILLCCPLGLVYRSLSRRLRRALLPEDD